jgi:hypothetical protein
MLAAKPGREMFSVLVLDLRELGGPSQLASQKVKMADQEV